MINNIMNYVLKKRIIALPVLFLICHLTVAQNPFASPKDISGGGVQGISALVAADLNGDNLKDVVVFSGKLPGQSIVFEWYEQKAGNEWEKHELNHYGLLGDEDTDFIGSAQACDFDGDGDMDFVFTVDGHKTGPIKVYLWENPGHDKCSQKNWPHHLIASVTGVHANDMRLGDMDGDGKTDIVIRHKEPDDVKILFQNNLKKWEVKSALPGYEGEGLALGDLNNNGRIDIAFTGYWFKAPENPRVEEFSKFIVDEKFHSINPASKEDIGDINGNGRNDIVISPAESWPNYGGDNYVLAWYENPENPETGTWTQHIIEDNFNDGHFIRLADFDADGNLDIVSGRAWNNIDLRLYLNEGGGKFKKGITIAEGTGGYSGAVLDMDNDGDIDMVIEDTYSEKNKPWFFENLIYNKK
jgi:hypothetical protein